MSTNYVDPKDEMLKNVTQISSDIQDDYTEDMKDAIALNEGAKAEALGLIGVDENGKVIEGSATDRLMDVQQEQTDFAISEIERQKEKAEKDYEKEQSAAYADYQKQINPYGVNAEKMAAQGLLNSGYAESSKVSMYNQYQARITAARESFEQIKADYNAAITNARLQNSSALAQIAVNAMQQRLQITLQFAMKNTELLTSMAQGKASLRQQGLSNYMSVYNQLLQEEQHKASLAENARQHDESLAFQKEKWRDEKNLAEKNVYIGGSVDGGSGSGSGAPGEQEVYGPSSDLHINDLIKQVKSKTFSKMSDATNFLNKYGMSRYDILPILTESQWEKAKREGKIGGETEYNSYSDYLKAYVIWAIEESR